MFYKSAKAKPQSQALVQSSNHVQPKARRKQPALRVKCTVCGAAAPEHLHFGGEYEMDEYEHAIVATSNFGALLRPKYD